MGHASRQRHPLSPLSSIAKSFCRYRGRLPFGYPVNDDREPAEGENIDAT
jgi:hypothetical protein